MVGQTSVSDEMTSLHLQVERDQDALSPDVATLRISRLLRTGIGVAILMMIVFSACALHPLASHASVESSRPVPGLAFSPALPVRGRRPARHAVSTGLDPKAAFSPTLVAGGMRPARHAARSRRDREAASSPVLGIRGLRPATYRRPAALRSAILRGPSPASSPLAETSLERPSTASEAKDSNPRGSWTWIPADESRSADSILSGKAAWHLLSEEAAEDLEERGFWKWIPQNSEERTPGESAMSRHESQRDIVLPGAAQKSAEQLVDMVPSGAAAKDLEQGGFWSWRPWKKAFKDSAVSVEESQLGDSVLPGEAANSKHLPQSAEDAPLVEAEEHLEKRRFWRWRPWKRSPGDSAAPGEESQLAELAPPGEAVKDFDSSTAPADESQLGDSVPAGEAAIEPPRKRGFRRWIQWLGTAKTKLQEMDALASGHGYKSYEDWNSAVRSPAAGDSAAPGEGSQLEDVVSPGEAATARSFGESSEGNPWNHMESERTPVGGVAPAEESQQGDMVPPGEDAKDLEQHGFWGWIPWNDMERTPGDSVVPGDESLLGGIVPPPEAAKHIEKRSIWTWIPWNNVERTPANSLVSGDESQLGDVAPPGEAAKDVEKRGFWGLIPRTSVETSAGDSVAPGDESELSDILPPVESAQDGEKHGFWGFIPWNSVQRTPGDSLAPADESQVGVIAAPGEGREDLNEHGFRDLEDPDGDIAKGLEDRGFWGWIPWSSMDRIGVDGAAANGEVPWTEAPADESQPEDIVPPGEVAEDLDKRGTWKWIPFNNMERSPGPESQLGEILDPGELRSLPDISKRSTTNQILSALTEKQTRLANHLKYSAACQFAYQTYAAVMDVSGISTPEALLGAEHAALVESFELQQVKAVPGFPELAHDIRYLVNKALPGSQVEVTPQGTLIDQTTGFNMLLVQDKTNPLELILTFGGTSAGASSMASFNEKILQEQWKANIVQGVGGVPDSTLQAVSAGETLSYLLKHSGIDIVCAGHSKGGMEAIVVGLSLGKVVYADNPAPVFGARGLIEATASAWRVREGSDVLQHSKRYVHTVSISMDPVSHIMGPGRAEFGVHDHIRMDSTHPVAAHVNVWESLANWLIRHPPTEIQKVRQRIKEEEELQLQREARDDLDGAQIPREVSDDVPDAVRNERKRHILTRALSRPGEQTSQDAKDRETDQLLLKLWKREERLEQQKTLQRLDRIKGLKQLREQGESEVQSAIEGLNCEGRENKPCVVIDVPDELRRTRKRDIFKKAVLQILGQSDQNATDREIDKLKLLWDGEERLKQVEQLEGLKRRAVLERLERIKRLEQLRDQPEGDGEQNHYAEARREELQPHPEGSNEDVSDFVMETKRDILMKALKDPENDKLLLNLRNREERLERQQQERLRTRATLERLERMRRAKQLREQGEHDSEPTTHGEALHVSDRESPGVIEGVNANVSDVLPGDRKRDILMKAMSKLKHSKGPEREKLLLKLWSEQKLRQQQLRERIRQLEDQGESDSDKKQ